MPSPTDFPTTGKVTAVLDDTTVVFAPRGTNYQLQLKTAAKYDGPINSPVEAILRASARKVWTVPSGGNFVVPIVGPTRIIQGRVTYLDERTLVIKAGPTFVIDLPNDENAIDLPNGPLAIGTMANVTVFPGATIEVLVGEASRR